jgi:RNA polymerase sigma-70 factor, ECF subfamily
MSRDGPMAERSNALTPLDVRPVTAEDLLAGYTTFFEREFPRVVRSVYLIVRDAGLAEELSQEAFIQLYKHWKKVSSYERPEAWVRRVAIRLSARYAKRERIRAVLERKTAMPSGDPEPALDLVQALRRLTVNQRVAIVMHYYEDRPIDEVAEILECSQNTVKSHLHRGRSTLHALLTAPSGAPDDD